METLEFKWTVSRGQNTYGYNICSLYVNGEKKTSCNGGGYDMQGTALADYLQEKYQERLLKIKSRADSIWNSKKNTHGKNEKGNSLYGMTYYSTEKEISLLGGCGFNCMQRIAECIGIEIKYLRTKTNDGSIYLLTDKKA